MTTIVQLLMSRDGLDESEALEIEQQIFVSAQLGRSRDEVLREHNIDPRELGLEPTGLEHLYRDA